jgi:hypothetical protein
VPPVDLGALFARFQRENPDAPGLELLEALVDAVLMLQAQRAPRQDGRGLEGVTALEMPTEDVPY